MPSKSSRTNIWQPNRELIQQIDIQRKQRIVRCLLWALPSLSLEKLISNLNNNIQTHVSVTSNAKSSMSSSSSVISGRVSNMSCSNIKWQVLQANSAPQAPIHIAIESWWKWAHCQKLCWLDFRLDLPSNSTLLSWATWSRFWPISASTVVSSPSGST